MFKRLFIFSFVLTLAFTLNAQQTKEDIQRKQQELQRELTDLNNTLDKIKRSKKQSIGQLALVQRKIKAREELMFNINKELRKIDDEIYRNNLAIYRYRRELDTLKSTYSKSLVFAYKNRSNYDYLNFIFSANTFNDALKRIAYLKSYKKYRETQVDNILKTQQLLEKKIGDLGNSKNEKSNTLQEQSRQLKEMETDRREKDQVVKQLKSQETTLASEIRSKEKTRKQLQASLQTIIRRELEEARRKEKARLAALAKQEEERKRRLAEQQGATAATNATDADKTATNDVASAPKYDPATTGLATVSRSDRSYSPFESTKEGLTLSLNFEGNKGRLPWPVSTGIVTAPFGSYEIPGTKLKGNSDGIDISLPVGSSVKAVADGEVSSVFDIGGEQAVVVRHGKYFTTYSHLSTVSVNKQDKVSAGTVIGKAAASDDGDGMLTFMVSNERGGFLNPEGWLKRR